LDRGWQVHIRDRVGELHPGRDQPIPAALHGSGTVRVGEPDMYGLIVVDE